LLEYLKDRLLTFVGTKPFINHVGTRYGYALLTVSETLSYEVQPELHFYVTK
jgi:hypothetical protein